MRTLSPGQLEVIGKPRNVWERGEKRYKQRISRGRMIRSNKRHSARPEGFVSRWIDGIFTTLGKHKKAKPIPVRLRAHVPYNRRMLNDPARRDEAREFLAALRAYVGKAQYKALQKSGALRAWVS